MRYLLFFAAFIAASAADFDFPAAAGPLTVDGAPDEAIWSQARVFHLRPAGFEAPLPAGGEARAVVRNGYLCLAARLPEPDRVSSYSRGPNAALGREDAVTFVFRVKPQAPGVAINSLTVAALGGYRADFASPNAPDASRVLVRTKIGVGEWSLEAAIPLTSMAALGYMRVERVRVPRPEAPELRWFFPEPHARAIFNLPMTGAPGEPPSVSPVAAATPTRTVPAGGASAAMLRDHLRKRMADAAAAERRAWEAVRTRADWERFRDERLARLRASMAPMPERTPLRAAVTRRLDLGEGYVIENVVYESRPRLLVTANLYLPAKVSGHIPAVVMVHSHHAPRTQAELQDMGMTWARAGAAVLVIDQLGAGERVQSNPWPREGYHARYALGMQFMLIGDTLMKWMVWDLMRGIDLLLERPYIDPKRITMIGAVAGGGDPAAVTAALDSRVAAVVPFNFGEAGPEQHYTMGPRPYDAATADPGWGSWETTRNLWRSASGQFFPWFICASVAPRAFLYTIEIDWPKTVEEEPAWARYKKAFELMGARDRLDSAHGIGVFPGPGEFANVGAEMRKSIYPALKRWLDIPAPAEEYRSLRAESELAAFTPALAAERQPLPAAAIALSVLKERKRPAASLPELRKALAARLGGIDPAGKARLLSSIARPESGFTIDALTLETEPGIQVPAMLLKPAQPGGRAPAVLAFSQHAGGAFLRERLEDLRALVNAGAFVCIADLRGAGDANRGPGGMGLAATELMLDSTLTGGRVKDARSVFRYLAARPEIDPARIALWGDSFSPVNPPSITPYESLGRELGPNRMNQAEPMGQLVALFTALYEDGARAVATRGGLVSFASALEDRFCYIPLDAVVPGILEVTDLPDVAAALKPRAVMQQAQVDGRNRAVAGAAAQPLGAWLAAQLR